eukprot:SAG31_NODE_3192_length_4571_cov_2.313730_2_plen_84_part_00
MLVEQLGTDVGYSARVILLNYYTRYRFRHIGRGTSATSKAEVKVVPYPLGIIDQKEHYLKYCNGVSYVASQSTEFSDVMGVYY